MYDRKLKLSDNFYYYELVRSSTADRMNIDNEIKNDTIIKNASALANNCLEPIRKEFGSFGPQSWYRGEELEKVICWNNDNVKSSFARWCVKQNMPINEVSWAIYFKRKSHPLGQAADIEIAGVYNDRLFDWCKDNLKYDQLIREFAKANDPVSGWVHISWSNTNNRQQAFSIG